VRAGGSRAPRAGPRVRGPASGSAIDRPAVDGGENAPQAYRRKPEGKDATVGGMARARSAGRAILTSVHGQHTDATNRTVQEALRGQIATGTLPMAPQAIGSRAPRAWDAGSGRNQGNLAPGRVQQGRASQQRSGGRRATGFDDRLSGLAAARHQRQTQCAA
jgi:hypothetical protein